MRYRKDTLIKTNFDDISDVLYMEQRFLRNIPINRWPSWDIKKII